MQPQGSSHSSLEQQNASILVNGIDATGQNGVYGNTQFWTHSQQQKRLPRAELLSGVFRQRLIDDIIVTADYVACLKFFYRPPTESCTLYIEVRRDAILRLASELYGQSIEYDEKTRSWVIKQTNGVNVYCGEWLLLEGAQTEAVEAYFGPAAYAQFRASSSYLKEKLSGKLLTKMVTLEARTVESHGLLKVFMDAEQLTFFESLLSSSSS